MSVLSVCVFSRNSTHFFYWGISCVQTSRFTGHLGWDPVTSWSACQSAESILLHVTPLVVILLRFSHHNPTFAATKGNEVLWALITRPKLRQASTQILSNEHAHTMGTHLDFFLSHFPLVARGGFCHQLPGIPSEWRLFDSYSTRRRRDSASSWGSSPSESEDLDSNPSSFSKWLWVLEDVTLSGPLSVHLYVALLNTHFSHGWPGEQCLGVSTTQMHSLYKV